MAVRIFALLIPLAITLPQLQTSPSAVPAPQQPAAIVPSAEADPAWSYETRRQPDAALTRVGLESPVQVSMRTIDCPTAQVADSAAADVVTSPARKALPTRAAPRLARAASPVKQASTTGTQVRPTARHAKRMLQDEGCPPGLHCAPVVFAKVTPVARRPL